MRGPKKYFINELKIRNSETIWIPKMVKQVVKGCAKTELNNISKKEDRAKELIYRMSNMFLNSYFKAIKKEDKKVKINSEILKKSVCNKYKPIIDLLIDKGIIERNEKYREKYYSRSYWLTEQAIMSGITKVTLKEKYIINKINKRTEVLSTKIEKNKIANYLINEVYPHVQIPSNDLLLYEGKKMVKTKVVSNKGKMYKMRGKKGKKAFLNRADIRCIEDDIELFNYLTQGGVNLPNVGGKKSGGRVACAFAMTPSWIRKLITIDNEETIEVDFQCLHPNLANALFGDNKLGITHEKVAKALGVTKIDVKKKHLSFFNFNYYAFANSVLTDYYISQHPQLYRNILEIKNQDIRKGKENTVTYKLFKEEVKLMSRVVEKFRENKIKGLYIYDAMRVKVSDLPMAKRLMNEAAREMNIWTKAV